MSTSERPGVYASYEVSGTSYSGRGAGTAGVAAVSIGGVSGTVYDITSHAAAVSIFGAASAISEICRLLIKNGAGVIKAVPLIPGSGETAPADSAYGEAFETLAAFENVKAIVCDSADAAVHGALKRAVEEADDRCKYKIGVVEGAGTAAELAAAAGNLNSERIVMVAPGAMNSDGDTAQTGSLAAAAAGAIISESDPAVPLNGAKLYGLGGVSSAYSDGEITLLVQGGVTPVECSNGDVTVVRGVTTRTKTGGAADATYRELTTVRIIDDVVPTVRDALKSSFSRAKNTARTRGAIRTRVILELEKKLAAEIIDGYGSVSVIQDDSDPTVCNVSFEFMVAHGLNRIMLTAYVTV